MIKLTKRNYKKLLTEAEKGAEFVLSWSLTEAEIKEVNPRAKIQIWEKQKFGRTVLVE